MRIAAIDIGTNSVHMIVVRVRPDLSFEVTDRERPWSGWALVVSTAVRSPRTP